MNQWNKTIWNVLSRTRRNISGNRLKVSRRQMFIGKANNMNGRNIFSNFSLWVSSVYIEHFDSGVFDAGTLAELKAPDTLKSCCTLNLHSNTGQFLLLTLWIYILFGNFLTLGLYCVYFWDESCLILYYCFDILLGSVSTW